MKKLYLVVTLLFATLNASAQEVLWQRDIKSSTQDFLTTLSVTVDGQYLVSGSSIQSRQLYVGDTKQNGGYDFHLLKLNQQGNPVWEKYFSGNRHDYLSATAPTQEGGFILAGTSYSSTGQDKKDESFGGSDIWIIKIDGDGGEQWQTTIGTSRNEEANAVVQSTDLGYFVAGDVTSSKQGFGGKDAIVFKLDKNGKTVSQSILGGYGLDEVQKMISTKDGGVLLGIYSRSGATPLNTNTDTSTGTIEGGGGTAILNRIPKHGENHGEGDYWVVKLDKGGNPQWQKSFGGSGDDRIKALCFFESGYLVGGESRSKSSGNKQPNVKEGTDLWFVALNENGDELWQKSYTFGNRDALMSQGTINDASGSKTKGFLIGGYTQSEGNAQKNDETFWMLYLDNRGGELWRKHIEGNSRQNKERLVDAKLQNDGSYIVAGTSAKEPGREDWKIVKLGGKMLEDLVEKKDIRIYPNPVEDYCYVEIGLPMQYGEEAEITLHDMSGRLVQSLKTKNRVTRVDAQNLPQGVYVVNAMTQTKNVNAKIVKK